MDTVNSGIKQDANFLDLKEIPQNKVRSEINLQMEPFCSLILSQG